MIDLDRIELLRVAPLPRMFRLDRPYQLLMLRAAWCDARGKWSRMADKSRQKPKLGLHVDVVLLSFDLEYGQGLCYSQVD